MFEFLIECFIVFLSYITYLLYRYCAFNNASFFHSHLTQNVLCAVLLDVAISHALSNTVLQNSLVYLSHC